MAVIGALGALVDVGAAVSTFKAGGTAVAAKGAGFVYALAAVLAIIGALGALVDVGTINV